MILRDFDCPQHGIFEALADSRANFVSCSKCGARAPKVLSFQGYIKVGETTDPAMIKKAIPKVLTPEWEKDREHAEVRRKTVKLPDGRLVERIVPRIERPQRKTDLGHNLKLDIERHARVRLKR